MPETTPTLTDDRHPEDYCHRCDGPNIAWFTPGGVWVALTAVEASLRHRADRIGTTP